MACYQKICLYCFLITCYIFGIIAFIKHFTKNSTENYSTNCYTPTSVDAEKLCGLGLTQPTKDCPKPGNQRDINCGGVI